MERIPNGRYTKEFREETVKMATEGGFPVLEISKRLSLPKSTLARLPQYDIKFERIWADFLE